MSIKDSRDLTLIRNRAVEPNEHPWGRAVECALVAATLRGAAGVLSHAVCVPEAARRCAGESAARLMETVGPGTLRPAQHWVLQQRSLLNTRYQITTTYIVLEGRVSVSHQVISCVGY